MALPPTSPPAIVRCGDTPAFQSPSDRREQHKRKPRLIFTSASQAAKSVLEERHKVRPRPEECAGVARSRQSSSAIVTIRHDLSCHVTIWPFWVAISAPRVHQGGDTLRCIATALRGLGHQCRREMVRSVEFVEQYDSTIKSWVAWVMCAICPGDPTRVES